jgi:hypothetical protein
MDVIEQVFVHWSVKLSMMNSAQTVRSTIDSEVELMPGDILGLILRSARGSS